MVGHVLIAALALMAAWLMWRWLSLRRRLRRLAEDMEDSLTSEGGSIEFSVKEDELAPVQNAAAELKDRADLLEKRLIEERSRGSRLSADLSHQLKTPLASLRLYCELDASPHQAGQIAQIERMERLIADLLRLEKLSSQGYEFSFEERSLRALAEAAWEELGRLWPDRRFTLTGDAILRCDGRWLTEALQNLLKNACQHTKAGGRISLNIERAEHSVFITVEDDGGGVLPEELPMLFERFFRAQGQSGDGSGLGLAIVREIIERHHGQVSAENDPEGLRVTVCLPVLDLARK